MYHFQILYFLLADMCTQILEVCEQKQVRLEDFGPMGPLWQAEDAQHYAPDAAHPGSSPSAAAADAKAYALPAQAASTPEQDGTAPQPPLPNDAAAQPSADVAQPQWPQFGAEDGWQEHAHAGWAPLPAMQVVAAGNAQPHSTPAGAIPPAAAELQTGPASLPGQDEHL